MKRFHFILLVWLVFSATALADGDKRLVILHTNDTHSTILPVSPYVEDTMKADRGGFLRRIALIEEQRKSDPELLLFDSGDFSQGSSFFTLFNGEVEVSLMNRMHYDACTLGNHEFDFGIDNLATQLRRANFPIVCANYDFGTTPLATLVRPYVVLKRKGLRIGVFGLSPQPEGLIATENYAGITFRDPVDVTREVVHTLRTKEKCDLVICLSHLGWPAKDPLSDSNVFTQTEGVDLVLGGHSHTFMKELEWLTDAQGKRVPVDQNGKHAIYVGRIVLNLSR